MVRLLTIKHWECPQCHCERPIPAEGPEVGAFEADWKPAKNEYRNTHAGKKSMGTVSHEVVLSCPCGFKLVGNPSPPVEGAKLIGYLTDKTIRKMEVSLFGRCKALTLALVEPKEGEGEGIDMSSMGVSLYEGMIPGAVYDAPVESFKGIKPFSGVANLQESPEPPATPTPPTDPGLETGIQDAGNKDLMEEINRLRERLDPHQLKPRSPFSWKKVGRACKFGAALAIGVGVSGVVHIGEHIAKEVEKLDRKGKTE